MTLTDKNAEEQPFFRVLSEPLDVFLDLRGLAHSSAQIIKLCTADLTFSHRLKLHNIGGMDGERLLDADAVGQAANGNCLVDAAVLPGDDRAFKNLHSLARTFLNVGMHPYGVADLQIIGICSELLFR